jgi:hypothetical protein
MTIDTRIIFAAKHAGQNANVLILDGATNRRSNSSEVPIRSEGTMKSSSCALFKNSILRACFFVWVMGILCGPTLAHALWLPWAKEEDKVKKAVEDVWKALIWNDKKSLKGIVAGPAAQVFLDQQAADIKKNNVKKYECRFKSVNVDRVKGKIAFAEYARIATLADGRTVTDNLISVVEKIDGQWKLLPGHKNKNKNKQEATGGKKGELLGNALRQPAPASAASMPNITPIQAK